MANEREIKMGLAESVCSVSGKRCKCDSGGSCRAYRTSLDNLPNELVRRLRTLRLRIDVAHQEALHCGDFDDRTRIWPQPEIREVERLLEAADALLGEILGD